MTLNLRELAEKDLSHSLEGEWGMSVTIIYADGEIQNGIKAQVLNFTQQENPETGEVVVINKPVISVRVSSLNQVPVPGDKLIITYPVSPVSGAATKDGLFSATRAPEDGTDIGFMRMYPQETEQEI